MPTSEFEKKIHRWASLICCFGSYRCLVGVGSICNLLELDLQMPGQVWKHLQFVGYEFADTYPGVGSICNLLKLDMQIHIGVNSGRGSIHNLLELDVQMPGRGWKHPQLVGIGFADAWSGSEASAIC